MYTRVGIAVLAILALGNQPAKPQTENSFNGFALVDKSGNIRKPTDYRDLYQTLGTYFVLDPSQSVFMSESRRIMAFQRIASTGISSSSVPAFQRRGGGERGIIETALTESRGRVYGSSGTAAKPRIPPGP